MTPDLKEIMLATIRATVPTLAVLVGILLNQNGIHRLDARIHSLEARMTALESRLHTDIVRLETRLNDAVIMLVNIGNELDKRITA